MAKVKKQYYYKVVKAIALGFDYTVIGIYTEHNEAIKVLARIKKRVKNPSDYSILKHSY